MVIPTPFRLAPDANHAAAARSFRFARNCLNHARLCPWTAEREEQSKRQWIESARYWQRQAQFFQEPQNERWSKDRPSLSWECELAIMLVRCNATLNAGVE
jgi:hypothetical protein